MPANAAPALVAASRSKKCLARCGSAQVLMAFVQTGFFIPKMRSRITFHASRIVSSTTSTGGRWPGGFSDVNSPRQKPKP